MKGHMCEVTRPCSPVLPIPPAIGLLTRGPNDTVLQRLLAGVGLLRLAALGNSLVTASVVLANGGIGTVVVIGSLQVKLLGNIHTKLVMRE